MIRLLVLCLLYLSFNCTAVPIPKGKDFLKPQRFFSAIDQVVKLSEVGGGKYFLLHTRSVFGEIAIVVDKDNPRKTFVLPEGSAYEADQTGRIWVGTNHEVTEYRWNGSKQKLDETGSKFEFISPRLEDLNIAESGNVLAVTTEDSIRLWKTQGKSALTQLTYSIGADVSVSPSGNSLLNLLYERIYLTKNKGAWIFSSEPFTKKDLARQESFSSTKVINDTLGLVTTSFGRILALDLKNEKIIRKYVAIDGYYRNISLRASGNEVLITTATEYVERRTYLETIGKIATEPTDIRGEVLFASKGFERVYTLHKGELLLYQRKKTGS